MQDYQLIMGDGQTLIKTSTDSASTACTSPIDFGLASANKGAGTPVWFVAEMDTTLASTGAATVQIELQDSADDNTYAVLLQSEVYAKAACVAGAKLMCVPLPAEHARYVRVVYNTGAPAITAGAINGYFTLVPPTSI